MSHKFMRGIVTALSVVFLTSTLSLAAEGTKATPRVAQNTPAAPGAVQNTPAAPAQSTPAAPTQSVPAAPKAAETPKAASQMLSGTIAKLDANTGMVTLTTADNQTRQLTVAKRLLEGLKVGDRVKVEMVGKDVQSIHKETRG